MIKICPVKIEALDEETSDHIFSVETFDSSCAVLKVDVAVTPENLEQVLTAVRSAVKMLELDD